MNVSATFNVGDLAPWKMILEIYLEKDEVDAY